MKSQSKKKFLFIVNSFPPVNNQNSLRALEISKRIVKKNIYPLILTRRVERREQTDFTLVKEIPNGIKVYKTNIIELKRRFSLRTLFFKVTKNLFYFYTYVHWVPFGYRMGKEILKKSKNIRFIYATGPPYYSHMIAYLLKKKFKIPLIIEYRDPWNFNPHSKKAKNDLNQLISVKIENKIINSADVIFTISEPLKEFLRDKFPNIIHKPIFSIPNGLNLKEDLYNKETVNGEISFVFIGNLYGSRDIQPLFKMISDLKKKNFFNGIKFSLKIFGKYNIDLLTRLTKIYTIQDLVHLGGFLTREQIFEEIRKSYLCLHVGENMDYPTIGFKVWDYLSGRKKILYLGREDSFTSKFLIENDLGITIPINNIKKGRIVLEKLFNNIKVKNFKNIIEQKKLEKYTWDNRVKDINEYLNENLI